MAVTLVSGQSAFFADFTGATYANRTLTLPGNWTVGNGIVISVAWFPDAGQTVSIAAGSNAAVGSTESNDGTFHIRQFHIKNLTGTPGATVVVTFSAATGFVVMEAFEITGQDTTTQPDAAGVGFNNEDLPATANAVTTGSITTNSANAFLVGYGLITLANTMTALDEGSGFTALPDITGGGGGIGQLGLVEYATRAVAGAGAVTMTATGATGGSSVLATAIAIKAATGGSSTTVTPATALVTVSGRIPTTSAFQNVRIREVLVNESGQAVGGAANIHLAVWYGGVLNGAPDISLNGLTTDAAGTTSWSIATGSLAYNQPIFYVAQDSLSYSKYTCARMIPSYE